MAKETIRVGVIGCGYWGPNHARNLSSLPECQLAAVCDRDLQRLGHVKSLHPHVECYTTVDEMLANAKLHAAVIATGVKSHFPLAQKALNAGLHCLVEKPMATSSEECNILLDLAASKKVVLMVGHTFLYSPLVRKIKEIVDTGDIGEIQVHQQPSLEPGSVPEGH